MTKGSHKNIAVIGGFANSLYNFRGDFIRALSTAGWKVFALAPYMGPKDREEISALDALPTEIFLKRNGLNPFDDIRTVFNLLKTFRKIKPDLIFSYTIKPVIWSSIVANFLNIRHISLITGLGYTFNKRTGLKSVFRQLIVGLYKFALRSASAVIFQNQSNLDLFLSEGIVTSQNSFLVKGSGINLSRYIYTELDTKQTKFLLIARLLIDKGLQEYLEAAKVVKSRYPEAEFSIVGPEDNSPNAFDVKTVLQYQEEGLIEFLGWQDDVRPFLSECQIFVLPSYHEGMPRSVMEAMAMGRPVITTNVPGCKDTIDDQISGILVPAKDSKALAGAMIKMINTRNTWRKMGKAGREKAVLEFDVNNINTRLLEIIDEA